jgi:hypothetical protein
MFVLGEVHISIKTVLLGGVVGLVAGEAGGL